MQTEPSLIRPFKIDISEARLDWIRQRVAAHPWGDHPQGPGLEDSWEFGTNYTFLRRLCDYWLDGYDWRAAERALNAFDQFLATVDGIDIHFYLERGSGPAPRPLILSHGWPGSIFEFQKLIEPLAHPERFGGRVEDAFTVVVPSLPGYGFSGKPSRPITPRQIARFFDKLMVDVLGLPGYIAQGGDWGAIVSGWLAYEGSGCRAVHFNLMGWQTPGVTAGVHAQTPEEQAYFDRITALRKIESGYSEIQRTKPQTLSYAMADSPVGQCAWIVEKFHGWSDTRGGFEKTYTRDQLLTNVMIYLTTDTFGTASWLYYGRRIEKEVEPPIPPEARIERPVGIANFPYEFIPFPPRSYVERQLNVVHWTDMDRGGHFAALECPDLLVDDIRAFARVVGPVSA